jgi:hypothetical protein
MLIARSRDSTSLFFALSCWFHEKININTIVSGGAGGGVMYFNFQGSGAALDPARDLALVHEFV